MDETLRIVRHLYGEEPDPEDLRRRLRNDPALAREHDELAEVKELLDRKSTARPDASVLDSITEAAAAAAEPTASPAPAARRDRQPVGRSDRSSSTLSRRLQQASLAAALVLVAALGWWQLDTEEPASTAPVSAQTESQLPPAARDLPEWDEGDDVVRLHRRLEVVNARSAPPTSWNDRSGLIPAQSTRP
ncbi:MAG: hypothetical protein GVY25_13170 [Bacteroidetes bacterium]|jgi:hypothetical protein|nr:hypothetical protein [Bacteroidota bacterium]